MESLVRGDRPHIESVCLQDDDVNSINCILDALEDHWKPRSNEIVAATAFKQLVQGDLGLAEYIEKWKEIKAAWNFEATYYKCLWNAILLGLRNLKVYAKCIKVGDKLTSAEVICIEAEVNNSDKQLSIMQSLSAATMAATVVQNPSVSKLEVVKARHSKRGPATEDRSSGH